MQNFVPRWHNENTKFRTEGRGGFRWHISISRSRNRSKACCWWAIWQHEEQKHFLCASLNVAPTLKGTLWTKGMQEQWACQSPNLCNSELPNAQMMPSASKLLLGLCVSYWWNVYSPRLPNVQPFCLPSIGKHHYKLCQYGQWALLVWGQKDRALFIKVLPLKSDWSTWSESLTTNSHIDSIQFLQGCKSPGAWPMWLSVCSVPTTVGLRPALFATWPHIMVRVSPYLTPYYDCGKHLTTVKYPDRGKQIAYYGSTWKNNLQSSVISVQSIAHIVRALEL